MARGLSFHTKHEVYGFDPSEEACRLSKIAGACKDAFCEMPELDEFDMIIPAAFPMANLELIESGRIPSGKIVVDLGGIKRRICEAGFKARNAADLHLSADIRWRELSFRDSLHRVKICSMARLCF